MPLDALQIQNYATRMQESNDLTIQAIIYTKVAKKTENFTTNIPIGSEEALKAIHDLGTQAIATLNTQNSLPAKATSFISNHSLASFLALSAIFGSVLAYANNASPIIGAVSGLVVYGTGRVLVGNCLNHLSFSNLYAREANRDATSSAAHSALAASVSRRPHLKRDEFEHNPSSVAITYQVLTSLLLDPRKRNFENCIVDGTKLYEKAIDSLKLNNGDFVDIEDIIRANLLNPEIILDSRCLKPKNDFNILQNEDELNKLLDEFLKLSNNKPIAAIISRPPNIFGIFYNPQNHQFLFYDPQEKQKHLQIQTFRSLKFLTAYLMSQSPIDDEHTRLAALNRSRSERLQNPNVCEISVLRKNDVSDEEVLETVEDRKAEISDPSTTKSSTTAAAAPKKPLDNASIALARQLAQEEYSAAAAPKKPDNASIALARQLAQEEYSAAATPKDPLADESAALALRLSQEGDLSRHLDDESAAAAAATPKDPLADESAALALKLTEEDALLSLGPARGNGNLSDTEALEHALASSQIHQRRQEQIADFTVYQTDNYYINGNSVNKYLFVIGFLTTPTALDISLPPIDELKQLLLDGFGIKLTDEIFDQISKLRDQENTSKKFAAFKKLIKPGPEFERDRYVRFQEYVDDYHRRLRVVGRY